MGIIICIFIGLIWLTLGIILNIYLSQMVNILNKEGIPSCFFEFMFSYNKFKKFIETCNDEDKKNEYTKLYKKALWSRRVPLLLLVFFILFSYLLTVIDYL